MNYLYQDTCTNTKDEYSILRIGLYMYMQVVTLSVLGSVTIFGVWARNEMTYVTFIHVHVLINEY